MSVKKVGNWKKAKALLSNPKAAKLKRDLYKATVQSALQLERDIKKGIQSQAPGGKPFKPLAPSTVMAKGSSKALIDTGFLINAITTRIQGEKAFVGLLRGTTNKDGEPIANIGASMEYGATVQSSDGRVFMIPARPFLGPSFDAARESIVERFQAVLENGYNG